METKLALRLQEAAKAIGVSARTVWTWAQEGRIPCVKLGQGRKKILLFPVRELEAWLSERARESQQQAEGRQWQNG